MLRQIGKLIEKRPWSIIIIVLVITVGFGSLLPALEMKTTMEDFLPDDETVNAENRVSEYFGGNYDVLLVLVKNQKSKNVVSSNALKEQYFVSEELVKHEDIASSMSVSGFVDMVCGMEYNKSLDECTSEQIENALKDLVLKGDFNETIMLVTGDKNEKIDYNPYPRFNRGKNIDSLDVKNYYIETTNNSFIFSIEVHDLSYFNKNIDPPHNRINVLEWYIEFENLIKPYEMMDVVYKLSARVEPKTPLWVLGGGAIDNIKGFFYNIINRNLRGSYEKNVYLWLTPPGQDISFPIKIESGNVTFDTDNNRVVITADKSELGMYGIAPTFGDFEMITKIGNTSAGVRIFQDGNLNLPWLRVNIDLVFLQSFFENIQSRPLMNTLINRIMDRFSNFSWEDFDDVFEMLNSDEFAFESLSLKDMESSWNVIDIAPDIGFSDAVFYIKPVFIDDMGKNLKVFLSDDFIDVDSGTESLMMFYINRSDGDQGELTRSIVKNMNELDSKNSYVILKATGNTVVEYEITDVSMEANQIIVPVIFIVIGLILLISFRRISYVIIPFIGLSVSIVWLFGTMVLLGMDFIIMYVALIPLLMGLGVDYSVHMFHNYRRELSNGSSPGEAIVASIQDVGMAMFLATVTTFIAFLSFLTATMAPMRDFGVLCAIGIAYTFIITITLQAALRYVIDRRIKPKIKAKNSRISHDSVMKKFSEIVLKHPFIILLIALLTTGVMISGAFNVDTGFDMEDFLPSDNPSVKILNEITDEFPLSSQSQEHILIEGDVSQKGVLEGIYKTNNNLRDDVFVLEDQGGNPKCVSILSVINDAVKFNKSIAEEFNIDYRGIPVDSADVTSLFDYLYDSSSYSNSVSEVLHKKDDGSYFALVMRVYTKSSDSSSNLKNSMGDIYNGLKEDVRGNFKDVDVTVTGENSLMYVIMESMTESQILSTGFCMVLAALVLIIAYRKPVLGLIAMIPVSISVFWIIGTMYFIGYSLNIMTIMITSMTIGLGITYAIHAVERFRLTADRTGDVFKAVAETIGHTGGALMIAAVTTIAGFGILVLAPPPVEQQFGVITAITILYAFITSIFILPPFLMYWGKWQKKRKGFIISKNK